MTGATTMLMGFAVASAAAQPVLARCDRAAARRRLRARRPDNLAAKPSPSAVSLEESCAGFLDDVVRELRGHEGLLDAVSMAVHRRPGLARWLSPMVVEAHGTGGLRAMPLSTPSLASTAPPVRLVMHRLRLAAGAGAPSVAVLEAGAADLRARDHLRARARAASAGIRSSSTVLSVLPLVLIALSVLINPGVVGEVFARPVFAATALCGVLLNQVGRIWMRRITQAVLP